MRMIAVSTFAVVEIVTMSPSIVMVIYGAMTNVSIGRLFVAGALPGIAIGLALAVVFNAGVVPVQVAFAASDSPADDWAPLHLNDISTDHGLIRVDPALDVSEEIVRRLLVPRLAAIRASAESANKIFESTHH